MHLPVNGACPKCGVKVRLATIEPHPTKPEASHYYECEKCGQVLVKVHDLSVKPRGKKGD
jgi:DNA-directed RNA polymerase subunit RPC12/RpoP